MPRMPKHPCSFPGCPRLTDGKYCEEHKKLESKRYEQFGRDEHHAVNYGRNWRNVRNAYVRAHPLCERCSKRGRYVKAEEVHHIKPLLDGGTNFPDNLVALCRACHAEVHAELGTRSHNRKEYKY